NTSQGGCRDGQVPQCRGIQSPISRADCDRIPAAPSLIEPDNARSNRPYRPVRHHPATRYDRLILKQVHRLREPGWLTTLLAFARLLRSRVAHEHLDAYTPRPWLFH